MGLSLRERERERSKGSGEKKEGEKEKGFGLQIYEEGEGGNVYAFLEGEAKFWGFFGGSKVDFVVQSGMHVMTKQYQKAKVTQLCPYILFFLKFHKKKKKTDVMGTGAKWVSLFSAKCITYLEKKLIKDANHHSLI